MDLGTSFVIFFFFFFSTLLSLSLPSYSRRSTNPVNMKIGDDCGGRGEAVYKLIGRERLRLTALPGASLRKKRSRSVSPSRLYVFRCGISRCPRPAAAPSLSLSGYSSGGN